MDLFTQLTWKDPSDATVFKKILARERTYDFLVGLHPSLDEVWGRILGIKLFPSMDEIFAEVRREESRKQVMLGPLSLPQPLVEASAMAARDSGSKPCCNLQWCDHFQCPYHTKEICWKIHGKPADWVPKNQRHSDTEKLLMTQAFALNYLLKHLSVRPN